MILGAKEYYRTRPTEFIEHWCVTYDPRNAGKEGKLTTIPFIMFPRQREFIEFLYKLIKAEQGGLIEKCRDVGATWLCCAFSVWLWLFWSGAAIGWGSRKEIMVDKTGDPSSIFEKMRIIVRLLPPEFLPKGFNTRLHMSHMKIINPENGSTITGEAGDNIGRGGRTLIYFKDEFAHAEHPELIEASLGDNTRIQIDISSVNGLGNVFHKKREAGWVWNSGEDVKKGVTNVFIFDWRDHPDKTQEWFDEKKKKYIDEGLYHIFAQEVERNYAASKAGVIIPAEWISAAIDADKKLGIEVSGNYCAALDVADSEDVGDRNALAIRKGIRLIHVSEWGARDTGITTRNAIDTISSLNGYCDLQYDSIGVGAGVKAEANRLMEEGLLSKSINFIPWNAGSGPQNPESYVIPNDIQSPLNKDFFANRKAQGWWALRRRFEKTYRAVTEGVSYPIDELIVLPSDLPLLRQIEKELSQPTASKGARLKLVVDKQPEGTRSPNCGDAVMMAFDPQDDGMATWGHLASQI
jgi:hypothetical protein